MSNFFAQPDALAYGKTLVDLIQEGVPEPLREHMVFAGNRPSSSILMTKLDVFAVGQLLALYEHRAAVQGKYASIECCCWFPFFFLLIFCNQNQQDSSGGSTASINLVWNWENI